MELYQSLAQTRLCNICVCLCDACYGVLHALVYKEEHLMRPVFHLGFRTALAQVCATHFVLAVCVSCAVSHTNVLTGHVSYSAIHVVLA